MTDPDTTGARVVLLGRSGFLASALAERLNRLCPESLRVVGSTDLDLTQPHASDRLRELLNERTVLLVAARARRSADPFHTFLDDIGLVTNVARAVCAARPRRCVYFSSSAVYGDVTSNLAITEETLLAPNSLYAATKVAAEGVLRDAAERAGTQLLTLRPCMVYGPGDTSEAYGPGGLLRALWREGRVRVFGDGSEVRDYLFVRDLVDVTMQLAFDAPAGVYNLSNGQSHSFQEILKHLHDILGRPFEVDRVPRARPRTDLGFDIGRLRAAVPGLRLTPLRVGLEQTVTAGAGWAGRS